MQMQSCHLQQVNKLVALTFLCLFFLNISCDLYNMLYLWGKMIIPVCYRSWLLAHLAVQMGVVWMTPGSRCPGDVMVCFQCSYFWLVSSYVGRLKWLGSLVADWALYVQPWCPSPTTLLTDKLLMFQWTLAERYFRFVNPCISLHVRKSMNCFSHLPIYPCFRHQV